MRTVPLFNNIQKKKCFMSLTRNAFVIKIFKVQLQMFIQLKIPHWREKGKEHINILFTVYKEKLVVK